MASKSVKFEIASTDGSFKHKVPNAFTLEDDCFNVPNQHLPHRFNKDQEKELLRLNISNVDSQEISVLMGADCATALTCQEFKSIGPNLPYIVKTRFGWSLFGPSNDNADEVGIVGHVHAEGSEDMLHNLVERFWTTESIGTEFTDNKPLSIQDRNALKHLKETTKFVNGHYQVPMLWKESITLGEFKHGETKTKLSYQAIPER